MEAGGNPHPVNIESGVADIEFQKPQELAGEGMVLRGWEVVGGVMVRWTINFWPDGTILGSDKARKGCKGWDSPVQPILDLRADCDELLKSEVGLLIDHLCGSYSHDWGPSVSHDGAS